MTIIAFPIRPYVKITSRLVSETRHVSARGVRVVRNPKPVRTFFLELVDEEGCACVWDGLSYLNALSAASDWSADGIDVRDHVAATWGRA